MNMNNTCSSTLLNCSSLSRNPSTIFNFLNKLTIIKVVKKSKIMKLERAMLRILGLKQQKEPTHFLK